jgi:hypothetical protein
LPIRAFQRTASKQRGHPVLKASFRLLETTRAELAFTRAGHSTI